MRDKLNVSFNFPESMTADIRPCVTGAVCFPLNIRHGPGSCGVRRVWALESHSKDAGTVCFAGGQELRREPESVHLYAPGCAYSEDTRDADLPVQETYWVFSGGELCGLERFADNPERFARFRDPENMIGSLITESAEFCGAHGSPAFWMTQSLFAKAIYLLQSSRRVSGSDYILSSEEPGESFSLQVERYLRRNFAEKVTLAETARYMKTSESLLSHKFKEETGVSPMTKLTEIRMERAKSLLLKGAKLKAIAEMTAQSSEYHLSRNFKAVTGLSPSEFRKKNM